MLAIVLQPEPIEGEVLPAQLDGQRLEPVERPDLLADGEEQEVPTVELVERDVLRLLGGATLHVEHAARTRQRTPQAVGIQDESLLCLLRLRLDRP